MSMLERLYNDYQNNEKSGDSREVNDELGEFDKKLKELLPTHKVIEVEQSTQDVCAAFEKQGFLNGVKYAMQLQHECLK